MNYIGIYIDGASCPGRWLKSCKLSNCSNQFFGCIDPLLGSCKYIGLFQRRAHTFQMFNWFRSFPCKLYICSTHYFHQLHAFEAPGLVPVKRELPRSPVPAKAVEEIQVLVGKGLTWMVPHVFLSWEICPPLYCFFWGETNGYFGWTKCGMHVTCTYNPRICGIPEGPACFSKGLNFEICLFFLKRVSFYRCAPSLPEEDNAVPTNPDLAALGLPGGLPQSQD